MHLTSTVPYLILAHLWPPHLTLWSSHLFSLRLLKRPLPSLHSVDFYSSLKPQVRHQLPSEAPGFGQVSLLPLPSFSLYMPLSEPFSPTRTKSLPQSRVLSHPPLHPRSYYWCQFMMRACRNKSGKGGTFWWEGTRCVIEPHWGPLRNAAAEHKPDSGALSSITPKFSV